MKYEAAIAGVAFIAAAVISAPAQADTLTGFANASAYLHAGPGDDFPVVAHVPPSADLAIVGCAHGMSWCDATWNGNRGWISAHFLDTVMHDERVGFVEYHNVINVPVVTFDQSAYWRDHYVSYPFYAASRYWATPAETPAEVRSVRYNGVDE